MKKLSIVLLSAFLLLTLVSCGDKKADATASSDPVAEITDEPMDTAVTEKATDDSTQQTDADKVDLENLEPLVIGATVVPHADILNFVVDDLKSYGIELKVEVYPDYKLLNQATYSGDIDANFFQHIPYLESYNNNSGHNLAYVLKTHIEPLGIYSKKLDDLDDIEDGTQVAIPDDATNGGRALLLLEEEGLIDLRDDAGFEATVRDIEDNPHKLEFLELDAAMIPRALDDVGIAVINTNYALDAGLTPYVDSLGIEESDSPYANIIVVTEENQDDPRILALVEVLKTDKVREYIENYKGGALVPSF